MKPIADRILMKRTYSIYRHQAERAAQHKARIPYSIVQLRAKVKEAIGTLCPYCLRNNITPKNFSVDHEEPVSDGGSWGLDNCRVCCRDCNTIKGMLNGQEYLLLLAFLNRELRDEAVKNLLSRIKAGSRFALYKKPS